MAKASNKGTGRTSVTNGAGSTKATGGKKGAAKPAAKKAAPRKTGTTGPFGTKPASKTTAAKSAKAKPSAKTGATGKGTGKRGSKAKDAKADAKKKAAKAATKKASAAKADAKKTDAKKTDAKKKAAKEKDQAKKTAKAARAAAKEARRVVKKGKKALKRAGKRAKAAISELTSSDAIDLFAPLTEGERCDAVRLVTETPRLAAMAKVGRYRVIAVEPMVFKPPAERAGHRLARVVIFDYSSARQVDASIDLDESEVFHATSSKAQPMLSREEETDALEIASADERVQAELELGDEATAVMHYWSRHEADLAYTKRSAAVMFGPLGARPSIVAVVDLMDRTVAEIVPAAQW